MKYGRSHCSRDISVSRKMRYKTQAVGLALDKNIHLLLITLQQKKGFQIRF